MMRPASIEGGLNRKEQHMTKRTFAAIALAFIVWSILDFVLHGVLLKPTYEATASLWCPMDEMNMPLMSLVTLVVVACFVLIYQLLVKEKSLFTGIRYGALLGLATGISMGLGSYVYTPIPMLLALSWMFGNWVEVIAVGAIAGAVIKS